MSLFFRSNATRRVRRASSPHRTIGRACLLALVWCGVSWALMGSTLHADTVLDFESDLEDGPAGIDWVYYLPGGYDALPADGKSNAEQHYVDPVLSAGMACNPYVGAMSVLRLSIQSATISVIEVNFDPSATGRVHLILTDADGVILWRNSIKVYGSVTEWLQYPDEAGVEFAYIGFSSAPEYGSTQTPTCVDDITITTGSALTIVDRSDVAGVGDPARVYGDRYTFDDEVLSDDVLSWRDDYNFETDWLTNNTWNYKGYLTDCPSTYPVVLTTQGDPQPSAGSTSDHGLHGVAEYPEEVRVYFSARASVINANFTYAYGTDTTGAGTWDDAAPGYQWMFAELVTTKIEIVNACAGIPGHYGPVGFDKLNLRGFAKGDTWNQTTGYPPPPQPDFWQPVAADDLVTYSHYEDAGAIISASLISTEPRAYVHNTVDDATVTNVYQSTDTYGLVVELESPYYYKQTFSNLQIVYVKPGDVLNVDCIIGIAGPKYAEIDDPPAYGYSQFLFSLQNDESDYIDWTIFDPPTSTAICGSEYRTKNCITNNPNLKDYGEGWSESKGIKGSNDNVTWFDQYVTLRPTGYIYQDIVLDTAQTYYVSMIATTTTGFPTDEIDVMLGDNVAETVTIDPPTPGALITIETGEIVPLETLTRLKIANNNPASPGINIHFVCIHTGDAVIAPGECYFADPLLQRYGLPDWALLGDAFSEGSALSNAVDLATAGDGISTAIQLTGFTDLDADYVLVVKADIDGVDLLDDLLEATSSYATLDAYIATEGDPYVLGSIDVHSLIPRKYEIPFTVPTATSWIGDFTLDLDSLTGSVDSARIHSVCLTVDGGIWPGYEDDPDYSDPGGYAWSLQCAAAPAPPNSGLRLWEWIQYIGSSMMYVVVCYIVPWLLAISNPIQALIDGLGLLGLFLNSLALFWGNWLAALLGALGTLLQDLFVYGLAGVINALLAIPFVSMLWDRISLLPLFANLLVDLFDLLIGLIGAMLNLLASMGRVVLRMFGALQTAINDPSMQDLGLPNCATIDDAAALAPLCWGMDAVDYVISSTAALQVAGVIVAFVIAYETIQWTIAEFSDMAGDM